MQGLSKSVMNDCGGFLVEFEAGELGPPAEVGVVATTGEAFVKATDSVEDGPREAEIRPVPGREKAENGRSRRGICAAPSPSVGRIEPAVVDGAGDEVVSGVESGGHG